MFWHKLAKTWVQQSVTKNEHHTNPTTKKPRPEDHKEGSRVKEVQPDIKKRKNQDNNFHTTRKRASDVDVTNERIFTQSSRIDSRLIGENVDLAQESDEGRSEGVIIIEATLRSLLQVHGHLYGVPQQRTCPLG
mmetsp:Transcript_28888/g.48501  ORF Transcript_28888/g.48501 Transcript_28888/m.48501 type:complete len:134 (+) Transcript_28888:210-611(+)